jgi:hypothetical protein
VQFQKCSFMGDNFIQLVEYCIERFSSEDLDLKAVISRRIWLRRNQFIFDNIFTSPQTVFKEFMESLDDFRRYNKKDEELVIYGGILVLIYYSRVATSACWNYKGELGCFFVR